MRFLRFDLSFPICFHWATTPQAPLNTPFFKRLVCFPLFSMLPSSLAATTPKSTENLIQRTATRGKTLELKEGRRVLPSIPFHGRGRPWVDWIFCHLVPSPHLACLIPDPPIVTDGRRQVLGLRCIFSRPLRTDRLCASKITPRTIITHLFGRDVDPF